MSAPPARSFDFTTLAPLGERVDRNRRFLQPGRAGGGGQDCATRCEHDQCDRLWADPLTPTTCKTWGPLRLAVPPLPQGGEGRKIFGVGAVITSLSATKGRGLASLLLLRARHLSTCSMRFGSQVPSRCSASAAVAMYVGSRFNSRSGFIPASARFFSMIFQPT